MTVKYLKSTSNHVLYRVTLVFENENLVASGILMEAESIEDQGKGLMFNVYCYNIQPQISINYATGESTRIDTPVPERALSKIEQDTAENATKE